MYATERQDLIERLVGSDGRVAVIDLAARFGVTTETVRRDLDLLERAGLVRRVHGGAVAPERVSTAESSVIERTARHTGAKRAIAAAVIATLPPGGSIYLDAGTTTAAVAALLADRRGAAPVEVVTHSMAVAQILAGVPGVALTAIGGRVRGLTAAAVGSETVSAITRLRPDVAIVGANGLTAAFGVSTPDPDEAAVKRAVVDSSRRVVVAADSSKFGAELLVSFAALSAIDVLATDVAPPGPLAGSLAEADVEVLLP
ncbi:DeoR/GlpR family DNA-binding transcription regulator [Microbacterium sp. bgisy189]|uniref:DeoR/GlpR family DNA-binding transcription regulator n=1 Tax=Microbacterium sp. bgisy189 TaxID=3413798 RepID=UPI003EBFABFA